MNILSMEKKTQILSALIEGNSIRSTERMTNTHRDTIMRLLVRSGDECQKAMDRLINGFHCQHIQVDELWGFVKKKEKRLTEEEKGKGIYGDQYVFIGIDADTKLIPTFKVGKRDTKTALAFMNQLQEKLKDNGRIQLTSDGLEAYLPAVEETFGSEIDYAQLIKIFGSVPEQEKRYSPPRIREVISRIINGNPDKKYISTSYIERQNLTIRMAIRRFTRLTNAFSKKLENLKAALSLHFWYYNFMRIHQTLRVTPAMAAGITDHVWEWKEILN